MPIEINPTETMVVAPTTMTANALYVDQLVIDGSKRDSAPPRVAAKVTPYAVGTPNVYAAESWNINTSNLYAAITRIPSMAAALTAVFTAMGDWHSYASDRQEDLATARENLVAAETARQQAYVARVAAQKSVAAAPQDQSKAEALVAANAIWTAADAAWTAAKADVQVATAALDPANPTLSESKA